MDYVNGKKIIFYLNYKSIEELETILPNFDDSYSFIQWKPQSIRYHVEVPNITDNSDDNLWFMVIEKFIITLLNLELWGYD